MFIQEIIRGGHEMNNKVIGIIGGMGPEATADLYMKIIKETRVIKEQDHFRVIIDSNPKIPDRTKAILGNGESPLKAMVETGKNLEKLGVDVCCIPCITAHYFIEDLQKQVSFEILNAVKEVNVYLKDNFPKVRSVGVIGTMGTIKAQLFNKYLSGFNIIYPNDKSQKEKVMEAIYGVEGIKMGFLKGKPLNYLQEVVKELIDKKAEIIIGGCTEIALVLKPNHLEVPLIDPMDVLAKSIVR